MACQSIPVHWWDDDALVATVHDVLRVTGEEVRAHRGR